MSIYGYMSKEDERTRKAMHGLGAEEEKIYVDDGGTAAYGEMLAKLERGDVLAIKSLGALGKNYDGILHEWAYITQVKGADIVVLEGGHNLVALDLIMQRIANHIAEK